MGDKVDAIIQVKRGTEAQRTAVTFREGELAYSTDVKRLYIGDGSTAGGTAASSKLYYGSPNNIGTLITGLVPGDYFLDTTAAVAPKLYALTGTNGNAFNNYGLICDNEPAVTAYTIVRENSTFWGQQGGIVLQGAFTVLNTSSAKWDSVYTTVYTYSGSWDAGGGAGGGGGNVGDNVAIIQSIIQGNSAEWESSYTTVKNNSAKWVEQEGKVEPTTQNPEAKNEFLKITINDETRYIRLWQI